MVGLALKFECQSLADVMASVYPTGTPIETVYLVDDNVDIRRHLFDVLQHLGYRVEVFGEASEFLRLPSVSFPAVLLLDMRMPGLSGLDVQQSDLVAQHALPIIFMSGESQNQEIISAMKAGAIDFLWKPFSVDVLSAAVAHGMQRARVQGVLMHRRTQLLASYKTLSNREKEVFVYLLKGYSNKALAHRLSLLPDTIKKYRAHIFEKMGVTDLPSLIQRCEGVSFD